MKDAWIAEKATILIFIAGIIDERPAP